MRRSSSTNTWMVLLATSVLAGVIVLLAYRSAVERREARQLVDQTYAVIDSLQDLTSSMAEAETGQRGYLLTGDPNYLKPYDTAVPAALRHLSALEKQIDNSKSQLAPETVAAATEIAHTVKLELAHLQGTIEISHREGFEAAREAVLTSRSSYTTAKFRADVEKMTAALGKRLRDRQDQAAALAQDTDEFAAASGLIAVFCLVMGVRGLITDNRSRRRLVERLEALNAATREADQAKAEFLANMSHELRSPLTAIIGFSELIAAERHGPLGNPKYVGYARSINSSGEHLLELINDILDFSKGEAGALTLEEELVDLRQLVASCRDIFEQRAAEAGIALTCVGEERAPLLRADKKRIRQILINLVTNAVKYTPQGGQVTIRTTVDEAGAIRLAVDDTGVGIAAEDIERVLQPFTQLRNPANRRHQGTGLGLPLTKRLVEMHGGSLTISSAVGVGSTVAAAFPPERSLPLVGSSGKLATAAADHDPSRVA